MLVAIAMLVITPLMGGKLAKQINKKSISNAGKQVKALINSTVPSGQAEVEQAYQEDYGKDVNQIAGFAAQSAKRQLLSYAIFPTPREMSSLIFSGFGRQYCQGVNRLIERINGLDCPTKVEIDKITRFSGRRSSRAAAGMGSRGSKGDSVESTILDALCKEKADSATVYANPYDIGGYGFWDEFEFKGREEAIEDCWYWQLGYWIIEDVIDTIAAMNAGSARVYDSPVKRLMTAGFSIGGGRRSTSGGGGGGYGGGPGYGGGGTIGKSGSQSSGDDTRPDYVLDTEEGLTGACTGRFCDDEFDVVHFNIVVLIRTKDIPAFMQQLGSARRHSFRGFSGDQPVQQLRHNQITILETTISLIDREDPAHDMYRYGDDAVVQLDLICEYLFSRAGYERIKPRIVRDVITGFMEEE